MKKRAIAIGLAIFLLFLFDAVGGWAENGIGIVINAGVEGDPSPGIGGAVNVNFQLMTVGGMLEVGPFAVFEGYGKSYTEEYVTGTVNETGNTSVYGVLVNWVANYGWNKPSVFFIFGSGFASVNTTYKKQFADGTSDGNSNTAGAVAFDAGLGFSFDGGFEVRVLVPACIEVTDSIDVLPVLLVMGGFHLSL